MTHSLLNHTTHLLKATVFSATVALTFISDTAFANSIQSADWRQTITGGMGVSLAQAPNGDYVTVGIETPNGLDPTYGATLTLQRYHNNGQPAWSAPVRWASTPSTLAGVRPYASVIDGIGNIFVLATLGDYNYQFCLLGSPCNSGPIGIFNGYWLIQKYSPDGILLWEHKELKVGVVPVKGVVDVAGDLYVAFDPNSAGRTAITSKLSGVNGTTAWTTLTPDGAKPGAIALTTSGSVLVAAASTAPTIGGLSINEYAQLDGVKLTRTVYPEAAGYYAPSMALGPNGEIAFTGKSANGLFLGLESSSRATLFTSSTSAGAQGKQAAFDALGHVIAAGTVPGASGTDWLVVRYDNTGTPMHAPVVIDRHTTANETPLALITASDGSTYISGAAGPGTSADPNTTQAVTVRLGADGIMDWIASETTGVRGVGTASAADGSVAVLTAGGMSLVHYPALPVNRAPTSAINVASVSGLQVSFNATGSTDPDGTVTNYQWTFGDGSNLVTSTPSTVHAYAGSGTYTASVVVVDNLGLSGAAATTNISVVAPPTPSALTLSSSSVRGGSSVTGRVTLSTTAGAVVSLSSSNPAVASVANTVNVLAGSSSASFAIRTYKVRTNTPVIIKATANGKSISMMLNVTR